jgi:hypothetical protein
MRSLLLLVLFLFACNGSSATEPKRPVAPLVSVPLMVLEDIPYVQVRINDSAVNWFIVDSGASSCVIDKTRARALGLKTEGQAKGTGAGSGTYEVTFAKNITYTLDNFRFTVPSSYVIDLSGVSASDGRKLDGLLGADFFQQFVVTMDYERGQMHLYDPKTYTPLGGGEVLPVVFQKRVPYLTARLRVAGHAAADRSWMIDTGSADTFNDELLAKATSAKREVLGGVGLGQPFKVVLGRAERIDLGRFAFQNVPGVSGGMKIGSGFLRRFTVTFDYGRQRIILEPNRELQLEFPMDASGLELQAAPEAQAVRLTAILPDSAAAEAGLRQGDLLRRLMGAVLRRPSSASCASSSCSMDRNMY